MYQDIAQGAAQTLTPQEQGVSALLNKIEALREELIDANNALTAEKAAHAKTQAALDAATQTQPETPA